MPTLQSLLGGRNLCGMIRGIKPGVLTEKMPPGLVNPTPRTVKGNTCTYTKINGTRKTARLAKYGSPSQKRALSGVSEVPQVLFHSAEHIHFPGDVLQNLRNPENDAEQRMGEAEVARQVAETKDLQMNLRTTLARMVLATGVVYWDGDGNLLPTSSGAVGTADFGVPAGNKNQLDVFGAGALIGASWATNTTDIMGQLRAIKEAALRKTGYELKHAIWGANILKYLLANDQVQELLKANAPMSAALQTGEIPNGLGDLNWINGASWFYNDDTDTPRSLVGADTVIFLPDPSPEWWELIHGTTPVPNNLAVGGSAQDILADITNQPGMFQYGVLETDAVGVKHVYGDTFLYALKVPNAIFQADVTP